MILSWTHLSLNLKKQTKKQNIHWPLSWQEHRGCHTYSFHYFSTVHNVQLNFKQLVTFFTSFAEDDHMKVIQLCWNKGIGNFYCDIWNSFFQLAVLCPCYSTDCVICDPLFCPVVLLHSAFCTLLLWWNRIPVIHAKRLLVCYYLVFICNFSTWKMLMCNMNFGCKVYHGI